MKSLSHIPTSTERSKTMKNYIYNITQKLIKKEKLLQNDKIL